MRHLAIWATAVGLLAIFLYSSVQIPKFYVDHADPQYYVQSAILWPRGELTFAASWIGSRDLVVFLYHLMFAAFGPSLDALSIGLALVSLATNVAIAVTVFSLVRNPLLAAFVTLAGALVFATLAADPVMSIMQSPASDNLSVMALAGLWMLWSLGWQRAQMPTLLFWLPILAGAAFHVRGELIVFPVIALLGAVPWICWGAWRLVAAKTAVAGAALLGGLALSGLLWPLWIDAPKPYTYKSTFLVFHPFETFARGDNGPASAALADELGLAPETPIPFWDALAATYSRYGAKASDAMMTRAGLEAGRRNLWSWLENGIESAKTLVLSPGAISATRTSWEEQAADVQDLLGYFDRYREASSDQYGNDATAQTVDLAGRGISLVASMRSIIPRVRIETVLPGLFCVLGPLLVLCLVFPFDRRRAVLLLPIPLYGIFLLILGSFTNGAHSRYLAPLLAFNLLVGMLAVATAFTHRRHAATADFRLARR